MANERLIALYKKTKGGHVILSNDDFEEYASLRQAESASCKAELISRGCTNVKAVKDESGDIVGHAWSDPSIE